MIGEPLTILLVEDNPDHVELIMRTLREHDLHTDVRHVSDGEAALDYIFRRNQYADAEKSPRPNLILLDLRLPKVDGAEVLKQVKSSDTLSRIPVVVLTTSAAEKDMALAYRHHANSYLVKPVEYDKFSEMMKELGFYWLAWNRQPK